MENIQPQFNKNYVEDFKKKDGSLDMSAIKRDINNTKETALDPAAFEKLTGQAREDYLMIEMKEEELKELKEKILTTDKKDYEKLAREIQKSVNKPPEFQQKYFAGDNDKSAAA